MDALLRWWHGHVLRLARQEAEADSQYEVSRNDYDAVQDLFERQMHRYDKRRSKLELCLKFARHHNFPYAPELYLQFDALLSYMRKHLRIAEMERYEPGVMQKFRRSVTFHNAPAWARRCGFTNRKAHAVFPLLVPDPERENNMMMQRQALAEVRRKHHAQWRHCAQELTRSLRVHCVENYQGEWHALTEEARKSFGALKRAKLHTSRTKRQDLTQFICDNFSRMLPDIAREEAETRQFRDEQERRNYIAFACPDMDLVWRMVESRLSRYFKRAAAMETTQDVKTFLTELKAVEEYDEKQQPPETFTAVYLKWNGMQMLDAVAEMGALVADNEALLAPARVTAFNQAVAKMERVLEDVITSGGRRADTSQFSNSDFQCARACRAFLKQAIMHDADKLAAQIATESLQWLEGKEGASGEVVPRDDLIEFLHGQTSAMINEVQDSLRESNVPKYMSQTAVRFGLLRRKADSCTNVWNQSFLPVWEEIEQAFSAVQCIRNRVRLPVPAWGGIGSDSEAEEEEARRVQRDKSAVPDSVLMQALQDTVLNQKDRQQVYAHMHALYQQVDSTHLNRVADVAQRMLRVRSKDVAMKDVYHTLKDMARVQAVTDFYQLPE